MAETTAHPQTLGATRAASRTLGAGLLVLAALLVLNSLLGPLLIGAVEYPISRSMSNQLLGLEALTLTLVVPWLIAVGYRALRHDGRAPLLALGSTTYTTYMFIQYVVGPEYATYSWTVLFHIGLVTLSGALAGMAWSLARHHPVPPTTPHQRRWRGLALLGLAVFVLMRYTAAFLGAGSGTPIAAEFDDARTFFWSIVLLDLGVVVPLTIAAGVSLLRGAGAGERAQYGVVGWFALVPPSVAAMAAVMLARNDPNASGATLALLCTATLVFWTFAERVLRPLIGASRP